MVIITHYQLIFNSEINVYRIVNTGKEQPNCPICNGQLTVRDTKQRKLIMKATGERQTLRIRRLKCAQCNKIHSELPDIIQPYKQYESDTIQEILDENPDFDCSAEESTTRRWRRGFQCAKEAIAGKLAELAGGESAGVNGGTLLSDIKSAHRRWLAHIMGLLINAGYTIHTHFAFSP